MDFQREPTRSESDRSSPYWLSHHRPERYPRTFGLRWGKRRIHLCARCTGTVLGLAAFALVAGVFLRPVLGILWEDPVQLLFAAAPVLAVWDWGTQSLGRRESTNALRAASGVLLGLSYGDVLALLVTGHWLDLGIALGFLAAYTAALVTTFARFGVIERVVEEHLPGA